MTVAGPNSLQPPTNLAEPGDADRTRRAADQEEALVEFGFKPPASSRGFDVPFTRGGQESRRRGAILMVSALAIIVVLLIVHFGCGDGCDPSSPYFSLLLVAVGALLIGGAAAQYWFFLAVPAALENPRHRAVAPDQLPAAQGTFPSRDAIFDPEYDRPPGRT